MADTRDDDPKKFSPKALADRADDGFLSLVRTASQTVRRIEESSVRGVGRIASTLKRDRSSQAPPPGAEGGAASAPAAEQSPPEDETPTDQPSVSPLAASGRRSDPQSEPPARLHAPGTREEVRRKADPSAGRQAPAPEPPAAAPNPGRRSGQPAHGSSLAHPMLDAKTLIENHPFKDRVASMDDLRPTLEKFLHGPHEVRTTAKQALVRKGRAIAEPIFVAVLRASSPDLTRLALEGLADVRSERLRGCIAAVIAAHDPELRLAALRVAQQLPGETARPFFAHAALDSDATIRRRAVLYLSWRRSDWAAAALRALCEDREQSVRWAAMRALATARPAAARELLDDWPEPESPLFRRFLHGLVSQSAAAERGGSAASEAPESADGESAAGQEGGSERRRSGRKKRRKRSSAPADATDAGSAASPEIPPPPPPAQVADASDDETDQDSSTVTAPARPLKSADSTVARDGSRE